MDLASSSCEQTENDDDVVSFLVFGFWFLVFGFWFLVFGFWFLDLDLDLGLGMGFLRGVACGVYE